jgi:large subunit ribosomal protein L24
MKFSTTWKASRNPRKQRNYAARAPLHIKRHLLGSHLSKELRAKHKHRAIPARKGDSVKIIRGQFKGRTGKVEMIKNARVYIQNVQVQKRDGSKAFYPMHPSNLIITELAEDKKRLS